MYLEFIVTITVHQHFMAMLSCRISERNKNSHKLLWLQNCAKLEAAAHHLPLMLVKSRYFSGRNPNGRGKSMRCARKIPLMGCPIFDEIPGGEHWERRGGLMIGNVPYCLLVSCCQPSGDFSLVWVCLIPRGNCVRTVTGSNNNKKWLAMISYKQWRPNGY